MKSNGCTVHFAPLSHGLIPGLFVRLTGRYEYRFVADEVQCDHPAALHKAANSLATENCVRIV